MSLSPYEFIAKKGKNKNGGRNSSFSYPLSELGSQYSIIIEPVLKNPQLAVCLSTNCSQAYLINLPPFLTAFGMEVNIVCHLISF